MKRVKKSSDIREKFIPKSDVINICNKLKNTQDKVLVYAAYNGISGSKLQDLRNLKYSDYCSTNGVININGRVVDIDLFFEELLEECKVEKTYYIHNGKVANGSKNKFDINLNSRYVLRGKPSSVNNSGLDPIGYPSLQNRMSTISDIIGENLTYNKLQRSKVVEDMCEMKKEWKYKEVEEYLKKNDFKYKASNILSLIREVLSSEVLNNEEVPLYRCEKNICESKLTAYQQDSIEGLYRIVAGLSMVNETQKRKIENEHYKLNEGFMNREIKLRPFMKKLIEVDKLYWEFIVNKEFNIQEQEYEIKLYADKEQYEKQNERCYVSYVNGKYNVFANIEYVGAGQREDVQCSLYSNNDPLKVISWIIDDFNSINSEKRTSLLNEMPYEKKDKQKFTPLYLNDIGLDMILALETIVEFKVAKMAFGLSEKIEEISGIDKVVPCIDVSTQGETFIVIIKTTGEIVHLKIEDTNEIKVLKSLGKNGRYIALKDEDDVINYFLNKYKKFEYVENCYVDVGMCVSEVTKEKMYELKKQIDIFNDKDERMLSSEEFINDKNKNYLNYKMYKEDELIVSMYDYDLSVKYNKKEKAYTVKRYVSIKGTTERIYDIFKTRDVEELVKWFNMVKVSAYEEIDYSMFFC